MVLRVMRGSGGLLALTKMLARYVRSRLKLRASIATILVNAATIGDLKDT